MNAPFSMLAVVIMFWMWAQGSSTFMKRSATTGS